ncbi:MAG: DUF4276 family protein [Candidatus Auribacterota bacterium]
MKILKILVEGETEQAFVNNILYQHFLSKNIFCTPVLKTKGVTSYTQVRKDLNLLLGESSRNTITTMIDFYNLPNTFPGYSGIESHHNCYDKVRHLEEEWQNAVHQPHFIPYIQLHEFEALLFSSVEQINSVFPEENKRGELNTIISQFPNPEEIDEGRSTSPAKRLGNLFAYKKTLHGAIIANRIGLSKMREKCPHFNEWMTKLEAIS